MELGQIVMRVSRSGCRRIFRRAPSGEETFRAEARKEEDGWWVYGPPPKVSGGIFFVEQQPLAGPFATPPAIRRWAEVRYHCARTSGRTR